MGVKTPQALDRLRKAVHDIDGQQVMQSDLKWLIAAYCRARSQAETMAFKLGVELEDEDDRQTRLFNMGELE